MQSSTQFNHNGDDFFLEAELFPTYLNFLLVSINQDSFFQLRLTNSDLPSRLRSIFSSIGNLFFYLKKNHNHNRAFRIDQQARIHITIPLLNEQSINVVLPTVQVAQDNIMPYEQMIDQDGLEKENEGLEIDNFFGKKSKRREAECLDLENTGELQRNQPANGSPAASGGLVDNAQSQERKRKKVQKERRLCLEVQMLLKEGWSMGDIKNRFRLTDRTAFKMLKQYQQSGRVIPPEQCKRIKDNQLVRSLMTSWLSSNPQMTAEYARECLRERGIERELDFVVRILGSVQPHLVYYSEQSGSAFSGSQSQQMV